MPPVLAAGVPARVAVPSPLSVNVTPDGSAPVLVKVVAAGTPAEVVTVKFPADPTAKVAWSALVTDGTDVTVNVKLWFASGATPLLALIVTGKDPSWVAVPAIVAVPSPLSVNVTPDGSEPVLVK